MAANSDGNLTWFSFKHKNTYDVLHQNVYS